MEPDKKWELEVVPSKNVKTVVSFRFDQVCGYWLF